VAEIHGAMQQLGVRPHDHVGIIGMNCPEWPLAMQASPSHISAGVLIFQLAQPGLRAPEGC